ncbi:MAG: hypothetical protein PHO94_00445 [Petrimonas sp.]|nr:hypothetical protein [Petrimonas sp.]
MKKLKYLLLISLALFAAKLYGDVIIVNSKPAKICVKIKNLNEFPDIVIIGVNDCFTFSKSQKAYRIKSNNCLKVNRACPLSLYIVKKDYLRMKDLDLIDWKTDKNVQKLNLTVKTKSFQSSTYSSVYIDFNLARRDGTTFYLYKSKMSYKYQNDRPDSVQFFTDETVDPLKPISVSTENASK